MKKVEVPEVLMKRIERDITILLAEDEVIIFLYLKLLVEGLHFHILQAKNGQQAIDMCKNHPEIDVVLMDIKMPIMDGYSAAKEIKPGRPNLPIIAQTSYALESERQKYSGRAFNDFISKPIDGKVLIQKIRKLVA
ncbi:MAG: response regulator [bacterium]|nr:response regulator [bacterium]